MSETGPAESSRATSLPPIDAGQVAEYNRDGHVVVRGLLDGDFVRAVRAPLEAAIERSGRRQIPPGREQGAYERAFIQVVNVGLQDAGVRALTHSPRVGAWVAALLAAPAVRILLEDTFLKLPHGEGTPWHQDASVAPMDPDRVLTAWIPLHTVAPDMGGLRFVTGSHHLKLLGPVDISEETQAAFDRIIAERDLPIVDHGVMEPGDVSFHSGYTVHGSWPNTSDDERLAIAIHCFADGARIVPTRHPNQAALLQRLAPGLQLGDLAVGPNWPKIYPLAEGTP